MKAEPGGSTLLMPKAVMGKDPKPLSVVFDHLFH
jgi:hypothetical protein